MGGGDVSGGGDVLGDEVILGVGDWWRQRRSCGGITLYILVARKYLMLSSVVHENSSPQIFEASHVRSIID